MKTGTNKEKCFILKPFVSHSFPSFFRKNKSPPASASDKDIISPFPSPLDQPRVSFPPFNGATTNGDNGSVCVAGTWYQILVLSSSSSAASQQTWNSSATVVRCGDQAQNEQYVETVENPWHMYCKGIIQRSFHQTNQGRQDKNVLSCLLGGASPFPSWIPPCSTPYGLGTAPQGV